jgi:ATP-dependent RNA helicase DHX57
MGTAELIEASSHHCVNVRSGCGKSTQVPQYILEDMITQNEGGRCNIIVTQPRRISALGLAQRYNAKYVHAVPQSCEC